MSTSTSTSPAPSRPLPPAVPARPLHPLHPLLPLLPLASLLLLPAAARADDRSEQAAAALLDTRLKNENPSDLALLRSVQGKDVVVVAGSMDHIETVLAAAKIPHVVIQPGAVANYQLRANQIVMVNCPGHIPQAGVDRLARFVKAGGLLYTTDWSLKNLVERAFPRTIAYNGRSTGSEVVPVRIDKHDDNIMSRMLLRKANAPQWWLEGGSYPIRVVDKQRVEVLAHSDPMGARYGASPIVVRFKWEDGEVIHVVSHFYRQMNANGPVVAAAKAAESFEGLSDKDKKAFAATPAAAAPVANVESSYAFQRMTSNIVTTKQKRNAELKRMYNQTVAADAPLRAAPEASARPVTSAGRGTRMRVLREQGDKVQVRDDMGNEGWLDKAQLTPLHD